MKRLAIVLILIILAGFCNPVALAAVDVPQSPEHEDLPTAAQLPAATQLPFISLVDFLQEMEMDFEEYITLIKELSETGNYPHYLTENRVRYNVYRAKHPYMPFSKVIAFVNVNMDYGFYSNITEAPDLDEISILLNKSFNLPRLWEPEILTEISPGRLMHTQAAEQFLLMKEAITDAELEVYIMSAYRSRGRQARVFADEMELRGRTATERSVARAGHSEHQTGLAIDLLHRPHGSLRYANFQDTELFMWLTQNAHKYGFILRYPEEYQEFHGYIFEPWHWRFVGVDIATAMFNEKIVLYEEFYGRYICSDVLHKAKGLIEEYKENRKEYNNEKK